MAEATRVYFVIAFDRPDPDVASHVVGHPPSTFRAIGTPVVDRPGAALMKRSIWTIESGTPESADFETQLDSLLDTLERHAPGIRAAVHKFGAQINCYAWRESSNPGFHLTSEQVKRAAALGLSFDFDIYAVEPDEPQPPN